MIRNSCSAIVISYAFQLRSHPGTSSFHENGLKREKEDVFYENVSLSFSNIPFSFLPLIAGAVDVFDRIRMNMLRADFRVFNIEVSISSFYGGSLTNDLELEGKSLSDSIFEKYSHLIYRQIKDVFHNFQLNKYVDIYLCVGNFGGFY